MHALQPRITNFVNTVQIEFDSLELSYAKHPSQLKSRRRQKQIINFRFENNNILSLVSEAI